MKYSTPFLPALSLVMNDDRGRTIQAQSTNPLNTSSMDRVTNVYADDGRVLYTRKFHNGSDTINVLNKFEYTTRGDLWKVSQAHRGNSYQLVALYEYNELGQLVDKKLHNTGGSNYLQSVDYRYTINGRLKSINNSELSSNGLNDETNDYFGMELLYDDSESGLTTTQRYDGMVSAIKWKGAGGASATTGQKSYVLTYDKTGRLETAGYRAKESTWDKEVGAQNETISYDHNGNIKTLTRSHRKHQLTGITALYISETIDNLTYEYASSNKNSLKKVTDASAGDAAAIGFNNGASSTNNDYKYDANGNLLKDANKGITSIVYNFLGKPTQVNFSDNRKIEYVYDAGGNKLTQKLFQNTTLLSTTDYVNGFVYENAVLSFFGSPEGRVVKNGSILEYQYSIADHQGNTRAVFTSAAPAITAPETNFEDNSAGFMNFPSGPTLSELEFFDHTDVGSVNKKSMVLNGHNSYVGVAKTFKVYPGDKIKAEAFVKYEEEPETPLANSLAAYAEKLALAFGVSSSSTGEPLKVYNSLTSYGGAVAAGTAHNSDPDNPGAPKAFVTIIFFDKNYNYLDAAWQQVDEGYEQDDSMIEKDSFDHVVKEVVAKEEGYAYVFISNENPTFLNVYFDDVKFTRTPSNVIQYNEYYPFGLQTSTSWTREGTKDNNYLYNVANELNKTSGWYEMFYRGYDPAIGRMLQVDPYAPLYASFTTYNYALNNPIIMSDPTGGQSEAPPGVSQMGWERYWKINTMNDPNYVSMWSESIGQGGGWDYLSGGSRESDGHLVGTPRVIRDKHGNEVGYKFSGAAAQFVFGMWKKGLDQGFITLKDGTVAIMRFDNRPSPPPDLYASRNGGLYESNLTKQDGFIDVDRFIPIDQRDGYPPHYVGVFISAMYIEYSDTERKYSDYNWIFYQSYEGTNYRAGIEIDPHNLVNQGPFYYGEDHFGKNELADNSILPPTAEINFRASMTLYGKSGSDWVQIGSVEYGFNFSNGVLTPIPPTINYYKN